MAAKSVPTTPNPVRTLDLDQVTQLDKLFTWIDAVAEVVGAASIPNESYQPTDDAILNATWLIREMADQARSITTGSKV